MGHLLTAVTIYASLLAYLLATACWLTGRRGLRYRVLWTAACCLLWAHAICAFQFYHHWSNAAAIEDTAEQTAAVMGWRFGEGIYFSYGLLVIWLVDVAMLWKTRTSASQVLSWLSVAVHAYAFFILFNGTVVFEQGPARWAGIIGTIWLVRLGYRHWRSSAARPRNGSPAKVQ